MGKVVDFRKLRRKKEHPDTSFLRGRFPTVFSPISRFLNKKNPFDSKDDFIEWANHERFITKQLARDTIRTIPELASGNPDSLKRCGVPPKLLNNDLSEESVIGFLSGYTGYERSPRWGLMAMIVLIEHSENLASNHKEFDRAVYGFFKYLDGRIEKLKRAYREAGAQNGPEGIAIPELPDEITGIPLDHFTHIIDGYLINFAYHTTLDPGVFEQMSLEWSRIPGSIGSRYPEGFFDKAEENCAFKRTMAERIRDIDNSSYVTSKGMEWLRIFCSRGFADERFGQNS